VRERGGVGEQVVAAARVLPEPPRGDDAGVSFCSVSFLVPF
jgi:hypothetical protein